MNGLAGLLASQNTDGGWPYWKGNSWTEPTVWALLALRSSEVSPQAIEKGLNWLKASQRADGGWSPRAPVEESTWVTALVLLLPEPMLSQFRSRTALEWLVEKTGRESSWVQRLRSAMVSGKMEPATPDGWPWFPDTAAWVAPTSIAILALRKARKRDSQPEIAARIRHGQDFLVSRVCADGGWNHGSSKALGYDGPSYPETTGLALAALKDISGDRIERSIARGQEHLRSSRSVEALSWLQLGLRAHGRKPIVPLIENARALSVQELALANLAADPSGGNIVES